MNLLFYIFKYCYPPVGGTYVRSYRLIRELSLRHNVTLVAWSDGDIDESRMEPMRDICREVHIVKAQKSRSFPLFVKSLFMSAPYKVLCYDDSRATDLLRGLIQRNKIDVLIMDYIFLASSPVLELPVRKCLLSPNLEHVLLQRYAQHGSLLRRWYGLLQKGKMKRYEIRGFQSCDLTVLVSANDEAIVRKEAPGVRTAVVEMGIDGDYLKPNRTSMPSPPRLIFVGALWYYPNVHAVLMMAEKILPLIRKEIPDVRFTVVGEKPSAEIMSLDGKNGITVTGWVPDVRPYIDGSSVYVLPVEIASGIRVKLFEALAMGIPVVAMKTACEGHDVRSGEDILIAETPEDFARKTVSLLQDPALWSRISSEGRKRVVERYRWDVSGKTLEEALSALA